MNRATGSKTQTTAWRARVLAARSLNEIKLIDNPPGGGGDARLPRDYLFGFFGDPSTKKPGRNSSRLLN